jgi:hypothetical protein
VARHRSPEGRGTHPPRPLQAPARATVGAGGGHRSVPTPVRRGVTAVAVAGGALSIIGAGVPLVQSAHEANLAARTASPGGASAGDAAPVRTVSAAAVVSPAAATTTLQPVALDPRSGATDGASLVKAAQMVEKQVAEQKAAAEKEAAKHPRCGLDESGLGKVKPHVRQAAEILGCMYGEPTMYGVAGRAGHSDHPSGLAVDFMVDTATGNDLAECVLRNKDALGVKYVIWRQRINSGSGWKAMEDRGGVTENHFDHVHVSFDSGAGDGDFDGC